MKPALISLFVLIAISASVSAQPLVIELADTAKHQLSPKTLNRQYVTLQALFSKKPKEGHDLMVRSMNQFQRFAREHELLKKRITFQLSEYYEPTGEASIVLVEWGGAMPDSSKRQMIDLLTDYYRNNRFPGTSSIRFRTHQMFAGGYTEKRTVRTGPGIIGTLEAAEKTTRPDTVKTLNFSLLELKAVPDVVYRFPNLEELNLSKNSIKTLPARLTADLPKLERLSLLYNALSNDSVFFTANKRLKALNIQGNKLTELPASVRLNWRLQSLWLGHNQLKSLDLRGLRRLNDLNLYETTLTQLPPSLTKLRRLLVLDLYYNNLTELPKSLTRLRRLEQLAVSHNKLKELPGRLSRLRRLQILYAHHNQIGSLPEQFARMRSLRVLDLGYNFFSVTPPVLDRLVTLEELDLNSNNLQELSPGLLNLRNLKKLYLRNNPIIDDKGRVGSFTQTIQQLEARQTEVFH